MVLQVVSSDSKEHIASISTDLEDEGDMFTSNVGTHL
jgi:hypothetical protein